MTYRTPAPTIAVVGMATIDHLYALPSHPAEDTENQALDYSTVVGGPAGRGSIAAARLGGEIRLLATCGVGSQADELRSLIAAEGISADWVASNTPSQHSAILVTQDNATRTTVWLPQPAADDRLLAKLPELLDGADAVLLDCTDETVFVNAVRLSRALGIPSVVDTGSNKMWARKHLAAADFVIAPAKYFAAERSEPLPEAVSALAAERSARVLGATCGGRGGIYVDLAEPQSVKSYAAASVTAVDTCGAGDTFHGAFTWSVGAALATATCFDVAAWSAGLKTAAFGNDSIPTAARIAEANPELAQRVGWR